MKEWLIAISICLVALVSALLFVFVDYGKKIDPPASNGGDVVEPNEPSIIEMENVYITAKMGQNCFNPTLGVQYETPVLGVEFNVSDALKLFNANDYSIVIYLKGAHIGKYEDFYVLDTYDKEFTYYNGNTMLCAYFYLPDDYILPNAEIWHLDKSVNYDVLLEITNTLTQEKLTSNLLHDNFRCLYNDGTESGIEGYYMSILHVELNSDLFTESGYLDPKKSWENDANDYDFTLTTGEETNFFGYIMYLPYKLSHSVINNSCTITVNMHLKHADFKDVPETFYELKLDVSNMSCTNNYDVYKLQLPDDFLYPIIVDDNRQMFYYDLSINIDYGNDNVVTLDFDKEYVIGGGDWFAEILIINMTKK